MPLLPTGTGGIMFSGRPSARPCVCVSTRPCVRSSVQLHVFWINETILKKLITIHY